MRARVFQCVMAWTAAALAGAGCRPPAAPEAAPAPVKIGGLNVFDGFERGTRWVVDSADDPADVTRSAARATEGRHSLRLAFSAGPKCKVLLRRDVSLDLRDARAVAFDAWTETPGIRVAVAFVTEPGDRYFESQQVAVPAAGEPADGTSARPGGWQTVRFRLDVAHFKSAESGWEPTSVLGNAAGTERIILVVYTGEAASGAVFFDNLSFDRPAEKITSGFAPRGLAVRAPAGAVKRWGRFELAVSFDASYASPFDPDELQVYADFRAPSGRIDRVPGFLDSRGDWRVRYVPLEAGAYAYEVGVVNARGRTTRGPATFRVAGDEPPGPVRVCRADPTAFELASGGPFYPVGTNVAWAADFRPYFEAFAAAGGNTVRVWLAPWSLPLASRKAAGEVDLAAAERLDETLDLAAKNGLMVQMVLAYHGEFTSAWKESPYAAVNGGPCAVPEEFFTDAEARAAFRRLLRYVAARYSSHPAVFAWELFNEADLAPALDSRDVVLWHREMARALRACDPVAHPVTTSVSRLGACPELDGLAEIDFLQAHAYGPDVDAAILEQIARHAALRKPTVVGEFGGDTRPAADQADATGVRLRAGLWLSLASPAAGTAMPWWWNTQIAPNDLWRLWRPVSALAARIDRRGRQWRFVHSALAGLVAGAPASARVQGVVARTEGLLYFYDPRILADTARTPNVLPNGGTLTARGLLDGWYTVEAWDGPGSAPALSSSAEARGGRLEIRLPKSTADFAVHFSARSPVEPGIGDNADVSRPERMPTTDAGP